VWRCLRRAAIAIRASAFIPRIFVRGLLRRSCAAQAPGGGPAGAVDALAKMRLALKNVSADMADFVVQGSGISSDAMTAAIVELEVSATKLGEELQGMRPEDSEAARQLLEQVSALAGPMDNVVALRGVAQWDFARFTFDEKVIPRFHEFVAVLKHLS